MRTHAVVIEAPHHLALREVELVDPTPADAVVRVAFAGVSTGTEKLLWSGAMPPFPGLGYPLVPGYETVGVVEAAPSRTGLKVGDHVFVPGARCYRDARGLFGGQAERLIVPAERLTRIDDGLGEHGVLLALAATAHHALMRAGGLPSLIVGHGILGRLLARLTLAMGGAAPIVHEIAAARRTGGIGYAVLDPAEDGSRDHHVIVEASGAEGIIDTLVPRLARGGTIALAGFYEAPLRIAFPPAFMREVTVVVAAEWQPDDMVAVLALLAARRLSLAGLITHRAAAAEASDAYPAAFRDPDCLKMVLDWRGTA